MAVSVEKSRFGAIISESINKSYGEDDMNVSSNRNYYFTEDGLILVMFV